MGLYNVQKPNFIYYLLNKKEEYSCFNIVHYSFIYLLSTWGITWWLDGCAPTAFSRFSSKEFWSWKNFTIIFLKKFSLEIQKMIFCFQNWSDLLWEKIGSSDREKLLKFEAEGWEFAYFLRSQEQFIQTVKGNNNFRNWMLF